MSYDTVIKDLAAELNLDLGAMDPELVADYLYAGLQAAGEYQLTVDQWRADHGIGNSEAFETAMKEANRLSATPNVREQLDKLVEINGILKSKGFEWKQNRIGEKGDGKDTRG